MNKNTVRFYIALSVVFLAFEVVSFALPFKKNAVFWIAYLAGTIAISVQLFFLPKAFASGSGVKSKFYGFPIARIGIIYLGTQILLSFLFMALSTNPSPWVIRAEVITFVFVIGFAVVGFVATDAVREEVERQDVQLKKSVTNMRTLQSRTTSLLDQCEEPSAKAVLKKLADALRFSDPVSSESTNAVEADLLNYADELQNALAESDYDNVSALGRKMLAVLSERNQLCKASK